MKLCQPTRGILALRLITQTALGQVRYISGKSGSPIRPILTLDPNKIVPLRQPSLDLSEKLWPSIHLATGDIYLPYGPGGKRANQSLSPYPSGTRGFLYYHCPSNRPRISGQLRFRVTPSDDPASFPHGYDLLQPPSKFHSQKLWCLPLFCIPQRKSLNCILTQLIYDGLITHNLVELVRNVACLRPISAASHLLFTLSDPFEINYANSPIMYFRAVTEQVQHEMRFKPPHYGPWNRSRMKFKSGIIKARFERSTLPEHEGRRIVVLRCLDILEPLVIEAPERGRDMNALDIAAYTPIQGQLLQTLPRGTWTCQTRPRPWSIDISNDSKRPGVPVFRLLW